MVVRSQIYYPEHILLREQEGSLLSCRGFRFFLDRLIGGGERWRSKHRTETEGLESKFGRDLDPSIGVK
jgi:hypothetical protein